MSEHARSFIEGVILGTVVIGLGGILIDTFSIAGLVIVGIAVVAWGVYKFVGGKNE